MNYKPPANVLVQYTDVDVANNGVKCLVYGRAGIGKTRLATTCPRPLVISAENGLLSLRGSHIPFIKINNIEDLRAAYRFVLNDKQGQFWTVLVDSVSEIAEVCLNDLLRTVGAKDPRRAYGDMQVEIMQTFRDFRDIVGKHVVLIAKMGRFTDQGTNLTLYGPMFPGQNVEQNAPYLVDEVFYLYDWRDPSGQVFKVLQTQPSNTHEAKDRSGMLAPIELANMEMVFNKIMYGQAAQ